MNASEIFAESGGETRRRNRSYTERRRRETTGTVTSSSGGGGRVHTQRTRKVVNVHGRECIRFMNNTDSYIFDSECEITGDTVVRRVSLRAPSSRPYSLPRRGRTENKFSLLKHQVETRARARDYRVAITHGLPAERVDNNTAAPARIQMTGLIGQ